MKKLIISLMAAALGLGAQAEVRLPAVIGSNMVLQQNAEANLWGWAEAGATVTVRPSWTKQKFTAKADAEGRWKTKVPTTAAGGPYTLTFSDGSKEKKVLENILMGEVWVCSGQSNMEMPVSGYAYQPVEGSVEAIVSAADYPDIRLFTVPHKFTAEPQDDCESAWKLSSPQSVRAFSATAYFFGRELQRRLKVPVGIIASDYGGTFIECWMSRQALDATKRQHPEVEQNYKGFQASCGLYNAMICPIKGFTAKGFIWYQGEANRGNWYDYTELQKALIAQWRQDWGDSEMPFYITQIAPYVYNGDNHRLNALFIDQQYKAADQTPHCEVASTQDIGERNLIHPAKKPDIAHRLAWLALSCDYGMKGLPIQMPRFKSFEEKDGRLTLHFDFSIASCPDNPEPRDNFLPLNPAKGFEVAGEDRKFYPATGQHQWGKNTIEVWSDQVPHPVAVRYAYRNWDGEANVKTQLGQPLPSFRSDDWEIEDL